MNKKILTTLIIAAVSLAGVFAYDAPNVILTADKAEVDYSFKVQKLNSTETDYTDLTSTDVENVVLDSTGGTTNSFTIATTADGNMHDDITFYTVVTTGEFLDDEDDTIRSGWYPVIENRSSSVNNSVTDERPETITYTQGSEGDFTSASSGTFVSEFTRGKHLIGTEIARFKLKYKADDQLVAGSYISTTTIDITTDKK
jgi:hypothetical protein